MGLHDRAALDLQRRGEQAVGLGEVGGQHPEGTDRLGPGDRAVRARHGPVQGGEHLRVGGGLNHVHCRQPVVAQPLGEHLLVQGDERGDEGLPVPDDEHLADEWVAAQAVLELGGGDVLASGGDDELLLASGDAQVAVLVEGADVAGAEPAVGGEGLGGGRGVVVVGGEDSDTADLDLLVLTDADLVAADGRADGADLVEPVGVDADRADGLGQAVALQDGQAQATVEVPQALPQRPSAGDDETGIGSHESPDLAEDETVGHGVRPTQAARGALWGVQSAGVGDGDLGGPTEQLELGAAAGLGVGGVVDLLQDAWDGQDVGGSEGLQVGQEGLGVGGVAQHALAGQGQQLEAAGVDVGQRQEQQQAHVGAPQDSGQVAHPVIRDADGVAVGELDALGAARGAGGVDDGVDVVDREGVGALVDLGGADARARLDDGGDRVRVQGEDPHRLLDTGDGAAYELGQCAALGDDHTHVGVGDDPLDLLGRARLVDGHGDEARAGDGHVQEEPVVGGVRHDADGGARFQPHADETRGHVGHLLAEGSGRDLLPVP